MDGVFAMMVDITVNSSNCVITGSGIFNDGMYYSSNCESRQVKSNLLV